MTKILNIGNSRPKPNEDKLLKDLEEVHRMERKSENKKPTVVIELSWQMLAIILLVVAVIFWGNGLLTLGIFIFVSLVLMSAAKPVVSWLQRHKFSKGWAVAVTYFIGFILFSALISAVVVPLAGQFASLKDTLPQLVNTFTSGFTGISIGSFTVDAETINKMTTDFLQSISIKDSFASVAGTVGSIFNLSTLFLAAVVFSIYMILDHDNILEFGLIKISSDQKRLRVMKLVSDFENRLGTWLLGQATVSMIAGIAMGLILTVLGVPFALPLAVFAALLDAIPNLGATIATIPALFVALLSGGPLTAFLVLVFFLAYQQIENNFIIPKIMGNVVGVRPIVVLLVVMSFLILFNVWGAVLAVPLMVTLQIFYEFYIDLQKLKAKGSI